MGTIISDIKNKFKQGAIHIQLIYINIGVFLVIALLQFVDKLCGSYISYTCESYLALPSSPLILLTRPWTIITYMFVHGGIWHILFNMLCLYWFGELFLTNFSARHLRGLYILGGIAGGVFFILSGMFLPNATLVGASAAIMAIIVATAVAIPDYHINMLFIGSIKMKYVAGAMALISVLLVSGNNSGGEIAHIGGALVGWLFTAQLRRGHDIVKWINAIFDFFSRFGTHKKPKMKIHSSKPRSDWDYNASKKARNDEINRILDKLKQTGYDSLTSEEKKALFDESKRK